MLTHQATTVIVNAVKLHESAARDIRLCTDADQKVAALASTAAQCFHTVRIVDLIGNDVAAYLRRQVDAWWDRAVTRSTTTEQALYCLVVSDGFRHLHRIVAGDIGEDQEEYEVVPLTEPIHEPVPA